VKVVPKDKRFKIILDCNAQEIHAKHHMVSHPVESSESVEVKAGDTVRVRATKEIFTAPDLTNLCGVTKDYKIFHSIDELEVPQKP